MSPQDLISALQERDPDCRGDYRVVRRRNTLLVLRPDRTMTGDPITLDQDDWPDVWELD